MRLNQLRDFISVIEAGSIRAAARKSGVSHPAMTKSLRTLEGELGLTLLRRSTRGVVCTSAGRAFLARARAVFAELRKAEEELADLKSQKSGRVSVGFAPTTVAIAPGAITRFLDQHPFARLHILEASSSSLVPFIRDETIDFAFIQKVSSSVGPGLKFRPLYRDRMVVVCRRGHPLRTARSLHELNSVRWIRFNSPDSGPWFERAFAAAKAAFPTSFTMCESFSFAFDLLTESDAVMLVPVPILQVGSMEAASSTFRSRRPSHLFGSDCVCGRTLN